MVLLFLSACGVPPAPEEVIFFGDTGSPPDLDLDAGPGDFLYQMEQVLVFEIGIDEPSLAALETAPAEDVHATFRFRDESYDVGLHLKGSEGSFRPIDQKAAFKIDFHQWDADRTFHGVRRLTLNNMVQDPSMLAEHTAYRLFGHRGLPAPRHGYAQLAVNGELYGLYGIVETLDEQFIDRWWPTDDGGNLYEGGYGADLKPHREDNFQLKEAGRTTGFADLYEVVAAIDASTPETYFTVLGQYFDVDALLDMWAVELAIADEDGYVSMANNYLLYHRDIAAKWSMIPWGPDQSFIEASDVHAAYDGELAIRCLASPPCLARLDERLLSTIETWEEADLVNFIQIEGARIEEMCRQDPRSPWGDYGCRDALAAIEDYAASRPRAVRSQLAQ